MEETGIRFDDVDAVVARVYNVAENLVGNRDPQTSYGCKFSLPYCVSVALCFGEVAPKHFSEECFRNSQLRSMLGRVHIIRDAEMEALFRENPNRWTQEIEIRTRAGWSVVKRVDFPKGDPENPMTFDETIEKFNRLTTEILSEPQRTYIVDQVFRLEQLAHLGKLFPL
jgi:2-methylcitrate dehydratase PrpD